MNFGDIFDFGDEDFIDAMLLNHDDSDEPIPATTTGKVQRQLADKSRLNWVEVSDGVFKACGSRHGLTFSEAVVTVDDEAGTATLLVESNLFLSPENVVYARKTCRRANHKFIVGGLTVDDQGQLIFAPEPIDVENGGDVAQTAGMAFSTLHEYARVVQELEAGRDPFEVFRAE